MNYCHRPVYDMMRAFRFRLYPSSRQVAMMLRALEASRRLWNDALAHRKTGWERGRQPTSYNLQASMLTSEREQDTPLSGLYSQVGQDILRRLDKAFKAFFSHRARYPRFKRFTASGSFTYPQAYNGSVKPDIVRKRLYLSKIGYVPVVFHRALPRDSRLKTCTVIREPDGRWFASLVFEDLRVRNMVRNHRLAKSIIDAAWGQLVALAEYKALKAGSRVVRVNAAYSTQECFYCGTLNKIALEVRKFVCVGCGRTLERDPNAARVVLKRGLAIAGLAAPKVGLDKPELKPVEMGPLLVSSTRRASSVDEAGTTRAEIGAGSPWLWPWEDVTTAGLQRPDRSA